jgi:putative oxidoreductase
MKSLIDWILSRNLSTKTTPAGSIGLLILRVATGLMMAFGHGWGKLLSYGDRAANFPDPLGVGSPFSLALTIFAEFFCSLALVLGFFTRSATIPLIITMLIAVFVIHGDDPFGKKELGLLYLVPFIALLFSGPGRYSIDRLFARE